MGNDLLLLGERVVEVNDSCDSVGGKHNSVTRTVSSVPIPKHHVATKNYLFAQWTWPDADPPCTVGVDVVDDVVVAAACNTDVAADAVGVSFPLLLEVVPLGRLRPTVRMDLAMDDRSPFYTNSTSSASTNPI